ncbi:hypothetical protein AVDCRST_MAG82-3232 [uncultured Rubrobacteraceae bacterium]|uniref:Uncharacterized protein n=1 Tax=uncultured Rubrobacteraceae bacterium TaxID=349277 RepID=A0A6J4QME7_9ACTN|nr:hypothetical protein AVDCRST_MAG82-3232 [uncultured Rubrobacteraceae bacterium]
MHGRASHLPASRVSYNAFWDEEGGVLEASGQIRKASVFGPNLVLRRLEATYGTILEDPTLGDNAQTVPQYAMPQDKPEKQSRPTG